MEKEEPPQSRLRAAVVAHPLDDDPRRIYAWEVEDPDRAAFVRAQLRLAELLPPSNPVDRALCAEQEETANALLEVHRDRWARQLLGVVEDLAFRRGFVEEITLSSEALAREGEVLMQREPILAVRLTSLGALEEVLEAEWLPRLHALDLTGLPLGDEGAEALATASGLHNLCWLGLRDTGVRVRGARALAGSPHLGALAFVDSVDNPIPLTPRPVVGPDWSIKGWEVPAGLKMLAEESGDRRWFHGQVSSMHDYPPHWSLLLPERR